LSIAAEDAMMPAACAILLLVLASAAAAQPATDRQAIPATTAVDESGAPEMKTLKEKLSDKPSDEQRVDNCGVPPSRRGPTPRPDCAPGRLPTAEVAGAVR
jgi:hypothetical protein